MTFLNKEMLSVNVHSCIIGSLRMEDFPHHKITSDESTAQSSLATFETYPDKIEKQTCQAYSNRETGTRPKTREVTFDLEPSVRTFDKFEPLRPNYQSLNRGEMKMPSLDEYDQNCDPPRSNFNNEYKSSFNDNRNEHTRKIQTAL